MSALPSLLDQHGNVVKAVTPQMPKAKPFSEMGAGGTPVWGGYIQTIERSAKWTGVQRYKTASDIVINVSIVAAGTHHFLNLIARPAWSVVPADAENPQAVELAELTEKILLTDTDTPWSRVVRRSAMYRFHGFGIQEWVASHREDGHIGFRDIESRPQRTIERWEISDAGAVEGVWQRSPQTGALLAIPRSKMVYLVEDTLTDSPEGLGVFRHLAEPYERLKTYLELEARVFERDLRGIPIGRAPITMINRAIAAGEITQTEATAMLDGLNSFVELQVKKSDTGIVLDSMPYESQAADGTKATNTLQWGMELVQGSANGLEELSKAIDRLQREMARIIGTEHLMMGDQGGNRALAADKSRNLYLNANAVLADIAFSYEKDIIDPLWLLNGFPDELKPTLTTEDVSFKDVETMTAALRDMASAGAVLMPDDPAIDDVRDLLGVSRPLEASAELLGALDDEGKPPPDDDDAEDLLETDEQKRKRALPRVRIRG